MQTHDDGLSREIDELFESTFDWHLDSWESHRAGLAERYNPSIRSLLPYQRRQEHRYVGLPPEQELQQRLGAVFESVEFALGPAVIRPYTVLRTRLFETLVALAGATGRSAPAFAEAFPEALPGATDVRDDCALSQAMQMVREDVHGALWQLARLTEIAHWLRDREQFAALWTAYTTVDQIEEEMFRVDRELFPLAPL